jgi:hypothetical protein
MTHKDIQLPVATGVTDGPALRAEYERGFIDGMQEQMRRSVDRAVNAMVRDWVGLTLDERNELYEKYHDQHGLPKQGYPDGFDYERAIETKLKEKNHG